MEIEPHEFKERPYNSQLCNECEFGPKHPLHSLARVLGIKERPRWVDIDTKFETKDSGKRESYDSGMVRDTNDGKIRFDLLLPVGVPYDQQFLTRLAALLTRGSIKYQARNWESASGQAELDRFKESAFRHFMQWMCGETDEDHMASTCFNLMGAEYVKWRIENESG